MSKRMIYMAYPLDNANLSIEQINRINKSKMSLLEEHGAVAVFDPGDAWIVAPGSQVGAEISLVNNAALDAADGVLAWLPLGVQSIGVPMEIARAGYSGKPVAVISDYWSWALAGGGPNVRVFGQDQIDAALTWLASVEVDPSSTVVEPLPVAGSGTLPTRTHRDDAGLDLYVAEDTYLPWGEFVDVPCGVQVELPSWSWGLLVGRSSTFRRRQIEVQTGIIDTGYRGQLFAACIWRPRTDSAAIDPGVVVKAGERLAQLIVVPNGTAEVEPTQVASLSEHQRGVNGFGSSGS